MARSVPSRGRGLPDNSQTIGQQAIPTYFATGDQQESDSYTYELAGIPSYTTGLIGQIDLDDDNLVELPLDSEQIYNSLTISCLDDTAPMLIRIVRQPENLVVFETTFITSAVVPMNFHISRPSYAQLRVYNLSDKTLTFRGVISITTRKKEV